MAGSHDSIFLSYDYDDDDRSDAPALPTATAPTTQQNGPVASTSKVSEKLAANRRPQPSSQPAMDAPVQRRARGQSIGAGTQRPMAMPSTQTMPQPVRTAPSPTPRPRQSPVRPTVQAANQFRPNQQVPPQSATQNRAPSPDQPRNLAQMRGQSPTQMRGPLPTQLRGPSPTQMRQGGPAPQQLRGPSPTQQMRGPASPERSMQRPPPNQPAYGPSGSQLPMRGQSPTQMRGPPLQQQQSGPRGPSPIQQRLPYIHSPNAAHQPPMRPPQQPQPSYRPMQSVQHQQQQQRPMMNQAESRPHLQVIPPNRPARTITPPRAAFVAPPSPDMSFEEAFSSSPEDGRKPFAAPHSMSTPLLSGSPSLAAGVSSVSKSSANYDNDRFAAGTPAGAGAGGADFWKRFSMVAHEAVDEKGAQAKSDTWLNKQKKGRRGFKIAVWALAIVVLAAVGGALAWHFTHNSGNANLTAPSTHDFGLGDGTTTASVATSTRSVSGGQARHRRALAGFHKVKKRRVKT